MLNSLTYSLPEDLLKAVEESLEDWKNTDKISRIWSKDASVWTNTDEAKWLGWLDSVDTELNDLQKYCDFAEAARSLRNVTEHRSRRLAHCFTQ
jgi:transaldolase / glucose-6-phosphate isomerase